MLELTSYGLSGLVAMLVVAFCFAFSDELAPRKEESSFDPIKTYICLAPRCLEKRSPPPDPEIELNKVSNERGSTWLTPLLPD